MTQTVAVVCGAGVSSTFLARALRESLTERSLDWIVEPLAADQVVAHLDRLSLVLVGHHMVGAFDELATVCRERGIPIAQLHASHHDHATQHALTIIAEADASAAAIVSKGHPHG